MSEVIERAKQLTREARAACAAALGALTPEQRERSEAQLRRADERLEDALERFDRAIEYINVTPETCRMRGDHGPLSACPWCGFDPLKNSNQRSQRSV